MTKKAGIQQQVPAFIESITGEIEPGYWKPQSIDEWTKVNKTTAYLNAWVRQQDQERILRKTIAIWVFTLISLQILTIFTIVILDALKLFTLNTIIVKLLIPSVLGEIFGMGFIVVKYLFRPVSRNEFISDEKG